MVRTPKGEVGWEGTLGQGNSPETVTTGRTHVGKEVRMLWSPAQLPLGAAVAGVVGASFLLVGSFPTSTGSRRPASALLALLETGLAGEEGRLLLL